jgi:hypothetical protein
MTTPADIHAADVRLACAYVRRFDPRAARATLCTLPLRGASTPCC